jgi:hypothetical protein
MSNTRLIRRDGAMLPGGYPFVDGRTNMRFDGFDSGGFGDQVLRIIKHRKANPSVYPAEDAKFLTESFVADELDEYQCQRFGYDARYCGPTDQEVIRIQKLREQGICQFCGKGLLPRYCPTCSGQKLIGYTCSGCGSTLG